MRGRSKGRVCQSIMQDPPFDFDYRLASAVHDEGSVATIIGLSIMIPGLVDVRSVETPCSLPPPRPADFATKAF